MAGVEEIVTLNKVDLYQLKLETTDHEFNLINVTKDAHFRIFRESRIENNNVNSNEKKQYNNTNVNALDRRLALIKCKDWYHPLESGVTQVFRCPCLGQTLNVFIFPEATLADTFTILVVNGQEIDASHVLLFENVLLLYANVIEGSQWQTIVEEVINAGHGNRDRGAQWKKDVPPSAPAAAAAPEQMEYESGGERRASTAETLAQNLVYGAEMINTGLTKGTLLVNSLVQKGASHFKTPPNTPMHSADVGSSSAQNQQQAQVDPKVLDALNKMRRASSTACKVTGKCVSVVAAGTNQLGTYLAPHVKKHGTNLISSVSGKTNNESSKVCEDVFTVAAGGLQSFGILYNGITNNGISLAKTVADETVDIVSNKYGSDAGTATHDCLYTAGNSALVLQNVKDLGPKSIAKRTAKDMGKNVIMNRENNKDSEEVEEQRKIA